MKRARSIRHGVATRLAVLALAPVFISGCASTQIGAQWVDAQVPKQSLAGTTVFVVCEAQDTTVRLLCESQMSSRLATLGAKPVKALATSAPPLAPGTSEATLSAAKAAGARSVLHTTLRPDYTAPSATPSFSFGIGGFGGSGGGGYGGVGGGVGVAVPVGGSSGAGMAASSALVDVAAGRVIWSAQATAPASSDLAAQVDELAGVLIGGLQKAALY